MKYPAKFIGVCKKNPFDKHAWEHTDLCYEYRGQTYVVTKDNNGYMGKSLHQQHEEAQKAIDERLKPRELVNEWLTPEEEAKHKSEWDAIWKMLELE